MLISLDEIVKALALAIWTILKGKNKSSMYLKQKNFSKYDEIIMLMYNFLDE